MTFPSMATRWYRQVMPAIGLAMIAGMLAKQIGMPLPWLIGPLFSIAAARIGGLQVDAPRGGRQAGQWAIGTALGLYFTPAVLAQLASHLLVIALIAVSAVVVGLISALLIERWTNASPATAFFAALPGGASEMVVLAEAQGGASDRVAAAHALRVMIVVAIVPFLLVHWGQAGNEIFQPHARSVDWLQLPTLFFFSLAGAGLFLALGIANAWVLGPLVCIGAVSAFGPPLSSLPAWLVNAGQLLLGTALGSRFSPDFFRAAPRFLSVSAFATSMALLLSGLFVLLLSQFTGISLPSLVLAASPGGMAEMSVTAEVLHLSVPLVTATHVLRVVLLTVCAPLLCRHFLAWRNRNAQETTTSNTHHSGDSP